MGKGGGGAPQPTSQNVTQTNLPEYARPYFEDLMKRGQEASQVQYQPYGGERTAGFTPLQEQAFQGIQNLGPSPLTGTGAGLTGLAAGQAAQASQYQPMAPQQTYQAPQYQGMGIEYLGTQAPQLQQFGMRPAERVRTGSFAQPGTAEAYMSPYMQNVVDVQQREAQRQADIARTQRGAQAVGAGAFGGSRQAIMEAEAARNLATQKGDIQAQGLQSAFQQAQQGYQTDAARRLQAALANQQAGLTVGGQNLAAALGVQQLGAQTGLQSQQLNQAAQLQAQQQALGQSQAANQFAQQNAQLAAQYGLAGLQAGEQSRQFGANLGMQGAGMLGQLGAQFGQLGQTAFGQQAATAQAQQQAGAAQQALSQDILNKRYEDFMQQTLYPQSQLQFYSSLLRGVPVAPQQTMYQYQAPASTANQLLSAGLGAYGVNKMFSKEGGEIKGYAEGGAVKGYAVGGNVANPQAQYEMALRMPIERLQQIVKGMPAPIEQGVALLVLNQKKQTQTAMEGEQAQAQLNQPTIKDRILGLNGLADMDIPEGGIAGEPEEVEGEEPLQAAAQGGPIRFQNQGEVPSLIPQALRDLYYRKRTYATPAEEARAQRLEIAKKEPLLAAAPDVMSGFMTDPITGVRIPVSDVVDRKYSDQYSEVPSTGIADIVSPKAKPKAKAAPKDSGIAVGRYAQEPDAAAYGPSSVYPTATGAAQPAMSEDDLIKSYAEKAAGYMKGPREAFRSAQKASEEEARKGITALREESKGVAALRAARELSKGGRRSFESIGEALGVAGETGMQYGKERRAAEKELRASQIDMAKAEMAFKQGDYELGARLMDKSEDRKLKAAEQAGLDAYRKEMVRLQGTELTEKERHNRATERYQMGYLGILGGKGDLQERRLDDVNKQKALLQASNETKTMGQIAMLKRLPEYKGMSDDQIRTALANKYYKMLSGEAGLGALAPSAPGAGLDLSKWGQSQQVGR